MRWDDPFFVHFAVPRARLAAKLPAGLELEVDGDEATVSLVALRATGPAPRLVERSPLARLVSYAQLNLRTYVTGPRGRGVFFLDSRVDRRWPTLARLAGWPYRRDAKLAYTAEPHAVALLASGVNVKGLPAPELPALVEKDAPERGLLERYLSYGEAPGGMVFVVRVGHPHWRTRQVVVDPDFQIDLGDVAGGEKPRLISAQLGESVDVTIDEVVPASEPSGLLERAYNAALLQLVRSTP